MAVDLTRANALLPTTNLDQAGAVFNDATRLLDGGLWSTPVNDGHNQTPYLQSYQQDIAAIQTDLGNALTNGITIGGQAYTPSAADTAILHQVQGQLTNLAGAAAGSVGFNTADAQNTLHTNTTAILNEINGSPTLSAALHNAAYTANTGATDNPFQTFAAPTDAVPGHATNGNLAQIGAVFNHAADLAIGGVNNQNVGQLIADFNGVSHGIQNILNSPAALAQIEQGQTPTQADLTTIHLQTLENQSNLQQTFLHDAIQGNTTVAARGTNDNILDMIDIVQTDPALNAAAGNGGAISHNGGFANQPGFLTGTVTHYQDNQAQTNFWSQFLGEANTLSDQLANVANGTHATPADVAALTTDLQHYQQFGQTFAAGQEGVFSARFNNELVNGTLQADTAAALHGLQTHDNAQIAAAGLGFATNAMDVSGNNNPLGGTNYVANATTVATATNPNGLAQGTIPVTGPADPNTGLATGTAMTNNGNGQGNANGQDPNHHLNPIVPVVDASHSIATTIIQDMIHAANTTVDHSHLWIHA